MQVAKIQLRKNALNPLRGQWKQQLTKEWTDARKHKLFMSEFKFKETVFCETAFTFFLFFFPFFLKKTLFWPEKEVLIWEQLIIRNQISAKLPARRNAMINKVCLAVFVQLFIESFKRRERNSSGTRARNINVNETILLESSSPRPLFSLLPEIPKYHASIFLAHSPCSWRSLLRCRLPSKSHS